MARVAWLLALFLAGVVVTQADEPRIKNVVYVMFENRAFDHMLGYLKKLNPNIDGLNGDESNPFNTSDPHGPRAYVNPDSPYVDPDPSHSIPSTTEQIFGNGPHKAPAPMDGFVQNAEAIHKGMGPAVMSCFNHTSVPIISTLAMEYALFDHWFASVPGPTFPNRLYSLSGTSWGYGDNDVLRTVLGWPQKSIFTAVNDSKHSWKCYGSEVCSALLFQDMRQLDAVEHMTFLPEFFDDAKAGTLPEFSFIDPSYFTFSSNEATDQHPSHSVAAGERLMKQIYEAVRASPQWNDTLLIITYDEHGGFHDHVSTPLAGIPNPDGKNSTSPAFGFDRLGVRIPTIMVSRWIEKGTVVHAPPSAHKPTADSHFDHTSFLATLKKMFGWSDFLTKRDAWAATFDFVWSAASTPRPPSDCPMKLPNVPTRAVEDIKMEGEDPVTELQEEFVNLMSGVFGKTDDGKGFASQAQAGKYVHDLYTAYVKGDRSPETAQRLDPRTQRVS